MELRKGNESFELLNAELNNPAVLKDYKESLDAYRPAFLPRVLGTLLVLCGTIVYGKEPSYLKFRAVEIIARVPYHSWSSAAYTLLTLFFSNEEKAMRLSEIAQFARLSQDNETMHVVVISQLARAEEHGGVIRHTMIPMLFAFFYFWASYLLYMLNPRYSFELNYLFENHAFLQYDRFLETRRESLEKKPIVSEFLNWYGRNPRSQYEFFLSVRNDEIIHRNESVRKINQ